MYDSLKFKKWFLLIFFIIFSIVVPTQETAFASTNNQMISNECLQDPDNCQDETPTTEAQEKPELTEGQGLGIWDYLKMLFALLFVLALLIFVLKFINKRSLNYQQNSLVRNIGGVNLGAQKSVQLVQIGKSIFVVGVGEDVQLIKEIENPEEIEQIINNFNERQTLAGTSPYISELVKKLKSKMKNTEVTEHKQKSFGEILNNKLSDIKKNRRDELEKWKEKERDK